MSKRLTRHKIATWVGAIIFLFAFALPVVADVTDPLVFIPQVGIPGLVEKGQELELERNDTSYLGMMVKGFYNYGISIAGILAAIILMAGGIIWLTSTGSSEKISQAKNLIIGSLTGLLLVFSSWLILKTVNPYLLEMKISQIKAIQRITFCCHPEKGNVIMIIDKNGQASCPDEKSVKCSNNTTCENTGTGNENKFGCVDKKNSYCCQYESKNSSTYKYCKPISISVAARGQNCSTINPDQNTWKWQKTENEYCREDKKFSNEDDFSCVSDICKDKTNSERCKDVAPGQYCYCYNEAPWYGDQGKEGEPCGNELGSICTSKGTGGTLNPSCTEPGWYHDYHFHSRSCGDNLYCCYPD
ncbi:MAG: pilin [Patescibacteria group bacterium]|nr:pilin [Patescibacteria group bacterium]